VYESGEYAIDFDDFEAKASKATLFLLCSPHNPTGRAWRKEELERMIAICTSYDVPIIADEIHADIVYERVHQSLGTFEQIAKRCIVLNAPSKTFNIAGLNTSYAIIPDSKLRHAYEVEQAKSGISNGNPFGIEALMAAYEKGEVWLEELKKYLKENRAYVATFLAQHKIPIVPVPTEATYLMWLDCKGLGLEHQELVDFFVKKAKVGLNDGESFGKAGQGFMRLNIGTSRKVLQEAMYRIFNAYKDRE
jgi:cystathionine beta-lyase